MENKGWKQAGIFGVDRRPVRPKEELYNYTAERRGGDSDPGKRVVAPGQGT